MPTIYLHLNIPQHINKHSWINW